MKIRFLLGNLVAISLLGVSAGSALAASPAADTTLLLNGDATLLAPLNSLGTNGRTVFADPASLSADGRFAAFVTNALGLGVPQGLASGIVVRDVATGRTILASVDPNGAPLLDPVDPSISADGRRVAFSARTSPIAVANVWIRDLKTGTTIRASSGPGGAPANGNSTKPSLSADGTRVAFVSAASNLTLQDSDTDPDAVVFDAASGSATLASISSNGLTKSHVGLTTVSLSANGNRVAFDTTTARLVPTDLDGESDVFVRDLRGGTTLLASQGGAGAVAKRPSISGDGVRVAFESSDVNAAVRPQIVFYSFVSLASVIVSKSDGGSQSNGVSSTPIMSADGNTVVFQSDARNFIGSPPAEAQVYRRDLVLERTRLVSRAQGPNGLPPSRVATPVAITANGACVAFSSDAALLGPSLFRTSQYLRTFATDCGGFAAGPAPWDPPVVVRPPVVTPPVVTPPVVVPPAPRPPVVRDTTAPSLTGVALPKRFSARRGAKLGFSSSEAGTLAVTIERVAPGQKRGGACKVVKLAVRRGACRAFASFATLRPALKAGKGSLTLAKKLNGKAWRAGSYRVTVVARDAAGNASKAVAKTVTVTR